MHWPYLAIIFGTLIGLGSIVLKGFLASRRQRLVSERGTRQIEGIGEVASQAAISGSMLLVAAASFSVVATLEGEAATLTFSIICAVILVLLFGVQLGRLLMRYQLRRLRALVDTVTGEVVTKSADE